MFLYYVLSIISVLLYIHGFFPIPATIKEPTRLPARYQYQPKSKYHRAVIVIIDALRLDFVPSVHMEFLTRAYEKNGCYAQLKVESPTVTLPRIKAITTGTIPQFIDIVLNLASPTHLHDSIIHRAKAANKSMVFYGDDIWLKLFPEHFMRSEGTTSFFVNDFWQVDVNVTRNVRMELQKNDWDIMILHYLGLDHIGHVHGPRSSLMPIKLKEMDDIIQEIHSKTVAKSQDTLLIITGDHGMRDSGGHGGSTFPETNVPFIVLGMPCKNSSFTQIDITTNLAILLGLEIPATSMGQLQYSLLSNMSLDGYLNALSYNTFLLKHKLDICQESLNMAMHYHDLFLIQNKPELGLKAVKYYNDCSSQIGEQLIKSLTKQNDKSLLIATITAISVLLKLLQIDLKIEKNSYLELFIYIFIVTYQFVAINNSHSFICLIIIIILLIRNVCMFNRSHLVFTKNVQILMLLLLVHPFTFMSSSFLEEENQYWYFFFSTFILLQTIIRLDLNSLCLLCGFRFLRKLNQVGDKWSSHPDLADWFQNLDNTLYLTVFHISSMIMIYICFVKCFRTHFHLAMDGIILALITIFKNAGQNIILARVIWAFIASRLVFSAFTGNIRFLGLWVLIISLLLKPYNHVIIAFSMFTSSHLHNSFSNNSLVLTLTHWWMSNMLYFVQGHDNSFASVDISSGYIGLSSYEPAFVFPQVLFNTYALPVLSHLLLVLNSSDWRTCFRVFFVCKLYIVILVFVVVFIQKHHLFIWSVFAPKMFVEASHLTFLFIEICMFYILNAVGYHVRTLRKEIATSYNK